MHQSVAPLEQSIILILSLDHAHIKQFLDLISEVDIVENRTKWSIRA
jgi:hypothetical protein